VVADGWLELLRVGSVCLGALHTTDVLPAAMIAITVAETGNQCHPLSPPVVLLLLLQGEEESDEDEADREAAAAGAASGVLERYSGVKVGNTCLLALLLLRLS
jgi:hypothetical protein